MNNNKLFATWSDDSGKEKALNQVGDAYIENSPIQKNKALATNYRTYIDIEPDRSVRTSMTKFDYTRFRPEEGVPYMQKRIMRACLDAYDRVGIIRNVIDVMSDFGSHGITLVHPNAAIEKFYQRWWREIDAEDRSERFLNLFYKMGNVVIQRSTAKITVGKEEELKKSQAADIDIESVKYPKREIPWKYDFLNPLMIDIENYVLGGFVGKPKYVMNLGSFGTDLMNSYKSTFEQLPDEIKNLVKKGQHAIPLDSNRIETFFYKKDDWQVWANPMTYAILDDLIMLEKMKLADLAALDGAISQIRLWTLGSLDHKLIPKKELIARLRNILASHTGGGTMDLVWGPELSFKESESKVYQFLGSQKYEPVLNQIYSGLGIPPSLTGSSSSGMTNNHVSLNTLIKRLEYGRAALTKFWKKEIEIVQKAMGFRFPAEIKFKHIVLSDENAVNKLWMDLLDRDVFSKQTVVEKFGENPEIEKVRLRREEKYRRDNSLAPPKSSPFHNPNLRNDVAKLLVTKDAIDDSYYESIDLPKIDVPPPPAPAGSGIGKPKTKKPKKTGPLGGRPISTKDSQKRATKRVLPRTGKTSASLWAYNAQKTIAEMITPMVLAFYDKKDVRSLTKAQTDYLEYLKLCIFTGIEPFMEITPEIIQKLIDSSHRPSSSFSSAVNESIKYFVYMNDRKPTLDEVKHIYSDAYIAEVFDEDISG